MLTEKMLNNGEKVVGVDSLFYNQIPVPTILKHKNFSFYKLDINNNGSIKPLVEKADTVVHLAALVGMPICKKHPDLAILTNRDSTRKIVKILSPKQRIISMDSNSGYGTGGETALTEESPINPLSLYAETKYKAGLAILEHEYGTVFRLATVMGLSHRTRLDLLVNNLVYNAFFDKKLSIFEGHVRRNYVHINDVINTVINCIPDIKTHKQIYNLGNDKCNCTKEELIMKIKDYTNITVTKSNKTDLDKRDYIISNEKIHKLGYRADIGLDETIQELLQFYSLLPEDKRIRNQLTQTWRNA
jgi:nucleoside-diphosphate-sugar epimerase